MSFLTAIFMGRALKNLKPLFLQLLNADVWQGSTGAQFQLFYVINHLSSYLVFWTLEFIALNFFQENRNLQLFKEECSNFLLLRLTLSAQGSAVNFFFLTFCNWIKKLNRLISILQIQSHIDLNFFWNSNNTF